MKNQNAFIIIIILTITSCVGNIDFKSKPDISHPKTYNSLCLSFDYPSNWDVVTKPIKKEIGFNSFSIRSSSGGTIVGQIYFEPTNNSFVQAEKYDAKQWGKYMDSQNVVSTKISSVQIDNLFPNLTTDSYSLKVNEKILGGPRETIYFHAKLKNKNCLIFLRLLTNEKQWEQEKIGHDLIFNSLKIH